MGKRENSGIIRTVCSVCPGNSCGLLVHVNDGVINKVEPADFPDSRYRHICAKGLSLPKLVYHPDRIKYPMKRIGKRGEQKWQQLSWDEAFGVISDRFKTISKKHGKSSIGWLHDEDGGILSSSPVRFACAFGGTWMRHIGPGDSAGPCGDIVSYGQPNGGIYTTNITDPNACIIWGGNFSETYIFLFRKIWAAKENGAKVIVIDPRFTPTASKADNWISIKPGTDAALISGLINYIVKMGEYDADFLNRYTIAPFLVRTDTGMFFKNRKYNNDDWSEDYMVFDTETNAPQFINNTGLTPALFGNYRLNNIQCKPAFQLLAESVAGYSLSKTSELTGVDPASIEKLALTYVKRKPVASYRSFGLQRTFHGDISYRSVNMLAAVTGNMYPNQRISSTMFEPFMLPNPSVRELSVLKMYEAINSEGSYPIKALWVSRKNMVNQFPDRNTIINNILPQLEFIVSVDMFQTETTKWSDVVLPAASFLEATDLILSRETNGGPPFIQLQQQVIPPLYESKSDFQIMTELSQKMGIGNYFDKNPEEFIRSFLSSNDFRFGNTAFQDLKAGNLTKCPQKTGLSDDFKTPSGRFEFYSEELIDMGEELPLFKKPIEAMDLDIKAKYPLCLISTHTRYRRHSQFANIKWLKELSPEPILEMNKFDAEKREITDGNIVTVLNARGKMKVKAIVHDGIIPGVVSISEGWSPKHFFTGCHQELTHAGINQAQEKVWYPNVAYSDVMVEVHK